MPLVFRAGQVTSSDRAIKNAGDAQPGPARLYLFWARFAVAAGSRRLSVRVLRERGRPCRHSNLVAPPVSLDFWAPTHGDIRRRRRPIVWLSRTSSS